MAGTVLSNLFTHSKTLYRIEQLEKKQDRHNNLIERIYICESQIKVIEQVQKDDEQDISEIKSRLERTVS